MGHHHDHTHDHHGHSHAAGAHHHDHGHDHGLGHSHAPASFGWSFAIGIALNAGFVLAEAGYGLAINSMALLADAGHNLSDVLSLVAAWGAMVLARRGATARYTFGLKGGTILAALFNSVLLMVAVGAIGWEAIYRLWHPVEVPGLWVMAIAGLGIIVNGGTALLFRSGQSDDINIRGAYLHMAADAAISAGVVLAGLAMIKTGWAWLDPLTSLAIITVIIWSGWRLMAESVALTINAAPATINPAAVRAFLAAQPGVGAVHDLHIWAMSTTDTALTAHLVMPQGHPGDRFLTTLTEELRAHHRIGHATLQIETDPSTPCAMHCDMAA